MADDLTAFLNARLDEDERYLNSNRHHLWAERPLREVEAKRKILALHSPEPGQHPDFCGHDLHEMPCPTLRYVAAVYSDHPDSPPEWAADVRRT